MAVVSQGLKLQPQEKELAEDTGAWAKRAAEQEL